MNIEFVPVVDVFEWATPGSLQGNVSNNPLSVQDQLVHAVKIRAQLPPHNDQLIVGL